MFDLLKKSRAVKFLCSACLLCSLGSFVNVNAEDNDPVDNDPVEVATAYVQGKLGNDNKCISFKDDLAIINDKGQLSGTLTWKTGDDTSGYDYELLENKKEDATLALFLVDDDDNQVAVTDDINLSSLDNESDPSAAYDLKDQQFFDVSNESGPYTYKPNGSVSNYSPDKPGVLKVFGIVTDSGKTSLISGPNKA